MKNLIPKISTLLAAIVGASIWTASHAAAQCCNGTSGPAGRCFARSQADPAQSRENLPPAPPAARDVGDPYLLDTDPVSGEGLGAADKQVILLHEGREMRFANQQNADAFKVAPQKYLSAVDEKLIRQQAPFYPLETCVVSGEKLGGKDAGFSFVYRNRLFRLSSEDHLAAFSKDPSKYWAKLDQAVMAKQEPTYATSTCIVSGEELGGEMGDPIDHVVGNRLVRFCCKSCLKNFKKDPLKYLEKLDRGGREGRAKGSSGKAMSYTCPMHPDVVKDEPGACPKCGMNLTKKN